MLFKSSLYFHEQILLSNIYLYYFITTYNMYLLEESMSLLHVNVNIYKGEVDL